MSDKSIPRLEFARLPTPVEPLSAPKTVVGEGRLWVKRDDLTHPAYGGNKVRKLEFLLAAALARKASTVATMGGIGSNHALATAVFARRFGLECHLALFPQPVTDHVRDSLRLYHAFGARLHFFPSFSLAAAWLATLGAAGRLSGGETDWAVFGPGGSTPLGTLGFVHAARELARQVDEGLLPEPETIFCALGSCGTLAGLTAGARLAGLRSRVVGVRVTPWLAANRGITASLARAGLDLLRRAGEPVPVHRLRPAEIHVEERFFGGEYGRVTPEAAHAAAVAADLGLGLDTTYTAKAFAAVLAHLRDEPRRGPVLFWNTFSSVDLSQQAAAVDWQDLPRAFHRFFRGEG